MADLDGDVQFTIAGGAVLRTPLQHVKGGLAYNESLVVGDQEGDPEIPVSAVWDKGTPGGMGETRRVAENSLGFHLGRGVDATTFGVWRLQQKAVASSTMASAITDVPAFHFEAQDASGNKYVYHQVGRYVYKTSTTGSTITTCEIKDLGANAVAGRAAYFGNAAYAARWFVPAGAAVKFWRITTVAIYPATDTWAQDGTYFSQGFALSQQGAQAAIARAYSTNCVDVSTDGTTFPNVTGATAFQVGDNGSAITDIADTGVTQFIAKQDNLWEMPPTGIPRQLTRFQPFDKSANYGAGMMAPSGSTSCFYPHGGSLMYWDGASATDVSPDSSLIFDYTTSTLATEFRFTYYEVAYASDKWFYVMARSSAPGSYIFAGERTSSGITWFTGHYPIAANLGEGAAERGAFVDSGKRLWYTSSQGNLVVHAQLGAGGQPHAGPSNHGNDGGNFSIIFPVTDFGYPNTLKQMRSMEARALDLASGRILKLEYSVDSGTNSILGSFTSDGLCVAYFSTPVTGYSLQPLVLFQITTAAADPRVLSLIVRAAVRPLGARRFTLTIDTARGYGNGAPVTEYDPPTLLSNLQTQVRGAPITFITPNGTSYTAYVERVSAVASTVETDGPVNYLIEVQMREWVLA